VQIPNLNKGEFMKCEIKIIHVGEEFTTKDGNILVEVTYVVTIANRTKVDRMYVELGKAHK